MPGELSDRKMRSNRCQRSHGSEVDFSYVVQAGDLDQDGIGIAANSFWILGPNELSGTYHFSSQSDPMPHAAVGPLAGHKVDGGTEEEIVPDEPVRVSVAAAQAVEGSAIAFPVTLSRAADEAVTVAWATQRRDGAGRCGLHRGVGHTDAGGGGDREDRQRAHHRGHSRRGGGNPYPVPVFGNGRAAGRFGSLRRRNHRRRRRSAVAQPRRRPGD